MKLPIAVKVFLIVLMEKLKLAVKGKSKAVPVRSEAPRREDVWVRGGIALRILNLDSRRR